MQRVNWILCLINFLVFYWGPQSYLKRYGGPLTKMSWEVPVAILRGAGWGMAPRFLLCLASPFATPNVFLNLRSLGWHMQGCQMRLVKIKGANRGGGWRGSSRPLSDQNIDVHFLSFSPTLYCKSRSGALQNVLWQYHRRSNTFVIKPSGYEFSRLSSFLHSCVFCATIYNKNRVQPCSANVETSMTFKLPKVSIDV